LVFQQRRSSTDPAGTDPSTTYTHSSTDSNSTRSNSDSNADSKPITISWTFARL
jgi:hypothetical protein